MTSMIKPLGYTLGLGLALTLAGCAASTGNSSPADDTATPDVTLANTYWKLTTLEQGTVAATQDNEREAHFVLHEEEHRVAGATGCNQLMGSYIMNGEQIAFKQVATTMMACPDSQGSERAFLNALNQASGWDIDGETLTLSGENNAPLAHFEAVHLY